VSQSYRVEKGHSRDMPGACDRPRSCREAIAAGLALAIAAGAAACATSSSGPLAPVDMSEARGAIEQLHAQPAVAKDNECVTNAEQALARAESLAASKRTADREESALLAQLALAGARCALESSQRAIESRRASDGRARELERMGEELRKAQEAQRRLEERVEILTRELELTNTEMIRTGARLKGVETKAEASAAVAEAQVLMRRAAEEPGSASTRIRCEQLVKLAEAQLRDGNFAAAVLFALRAQELLGARRHPSRGGAPGERSAPPKRAR
jgi:hypothetical protein